MGTSFNLSPLFVYFMHLSLPYFIASINMKAMSQSLHLPWEPIKLPLRWVPFTIAYFRSLFSTTSCFSFCLLPFIINDIHITSPPSIVSCVWTFPDLTMCDKSFYPFKNVSHDPPMAYCLTLTPHPSLTPHLKELEYWGIYWTFHRSHHPS